MSYKLAFLDNNLPEYLPPNMWPPGSSDCNPCDYNVWSSLVQRFLCGNLWSRLFAWAPRNMLGRLSRGEIDAAIDIVRPRLRKWLDWEGKFWWFVIKRIFKRYNSQSANMLCILSLYHSSLTQNLRFFLKFWILVRLVWFFVKSYLDLYNKFSKNIRLNRGRL